MKKSIMLGIDIGSSSVKALLIDSDFTVIAMADRKNPVLIPRPGWSEYKPELWWDYVKQDIAECLQKAKINADNIISVGISGCGCCMVPLDAQGNSVYNSIPWTDQRADEEVKFLEKNCRDLIFAKCGNIPNMLSPIPHLMWLKNNEKSIYDKTYKYTEASGYIGQKFTGNFTLDYSMASALDYGMDTARLDFDKDLIDAMDLDITKFPKLHANTESIGSISAEVSKETGLKQGTPVYIAGLDIFAATIAAGATSSGQGFYSTGSAGNMIVVSDKRTSSPNVTNAISITDSSLYYTFGSQGSLGYSFDWFVENFCELEVKASEMLNKTIKAYQIVDLEVAKSKPGAGGLLYMPYLFGKFHPDFNPDAQGVFFGIGPTTTKIDMLRAVMEGAVFNMYETIKVINGLGVKLEQIITSGGPSRSAIWCQIMSDITGISIKSIDIPEATAIGSALLGGIGAGLFKSFDDVNKKYEKPARIYEPDMANHNIYEKLFEIYKVVYSGSVEGFEKLMHFKKNL
ncbi:MAG: FGGY family carbohydrate kinase [Actinomycetota bacterium]